MLSPSDRIQIKAFFPDIPLIFAGSKFEFLQLKRQCHPIVSVSTTQLVSPRF